MLLLLSLGLYLSVIEFFHVQTVFVLLQFPVLCINLVLDDLVQCQNVPRFHRTRFDQSFSSCLKACLCEMHLCSSKVARYIWASCSGIAFFSRIKVTHFEVRYWRHYTVMVGFLRRSVAHWVISLDWHWTCRLQWWEHISRTAPLSAVFEVVYINGSGSFIYLRAEEIGFRYISRG